GVMPTIEDGPDRFDEGAITGATLIALRPRLGAAKPADVALIHLPIIRTVRIPAECAGMHKSSWFHDCPPHVDVPLMIHYQHEEGRLPSSATWEKPAWRALLAVPRLTANGTSL